VTTNKPSLIFIYPNQFGYHTDSFKYCIYLKDKFKITYFCFDQGLDKIVIDDMDIVYANFQLPKVKRLYSYFKSIIQFTQKEKTDILFTIQFKFSFIIGLLAKSKVKIIDFRTGDLSSNPVKRYFKNWLIWFDSIFYSKKTVISAGLLEKLHLSQNKSLILPLGADIISMQTTHFDHINMLYVGSFSGRNIHETIEGMAFFMKNTSFNVPIQYTIIGFGSVDDEIKIKDAISRNNLGEKITLIGRVKHTELQPYFEKCNIGVAYVPITLFYEHQPATKLFEYALSGKFSIATNTFENRKVISQENGILIKDTPEEFSNALAYVNSNLNNLNETLIRNSLKQYKWETITNEILLPFLNKQLSIK
jgi:glycosyltransferase involved in cell wall biosynthesis